MSDLKTDLLFAMTADLEEPQAVGATPRGNRRIYYVTGGEFEGPKLKGEVLQGGGDWARVRPDGAVELDVRATLRTDDGELIYTTYRGIIRGAPNSPDFYFRTAPMYETASEKYGWLNQIVAVGVGNLTPTGVSYNVYEVL
jgi:hypothetical protein